MTQLYFVRHAQPDYRTGIDSTFPLSEEGRQDRLQAQAILHAVPLTAAVSSPYRRSLDTILPIVEEHGLPLETDERLRERDKGPQFYGKTNKTAFFRRLWAEPDFCDEGGETFLSCQRRNVSAVREILSRYPGGRVLIGTHGTALSTILQAYDPSFTVDSFFRIIDEMPYVIRLDFEGEIIQGMEELLSVHKSCHGQQ